MTNNPKFIMIESVDDSGKPVRKFVPADQAKERTHYAVYGDYVIISLEQEQYSNVVAIEMAKNKLLEQMIDAIRELSKSEEFWIVKDIGENRKTVGWKVYFPQMDK